MCVLMKERARLDERVDEKELNAFKHHLLEIGEAVALAFRERQDLDDFKTKLMVYGEYYLYKFQGLIKKKPVRSFDEFLNISESERHALSRLAQALGSEYF